MHKRDSSEIKQLENVEILLIDYIAFGDLFLAYYATAIVEPEDDGDHVIWKLRDIVARQISPIGRDLERYEAFIEAARGSTGIANTIIGRALPPSQPVENLATPAET